MLTYLDRLGAWFAKKFGSPINTSAALILAAYTLLWGFWLANPFWTVFSQAALYSHLSNIAPEIVWGLIAMTVGTVMWASIIKHTYNTLSRGAFLGFLHWGTIAIGYFLGDWRNTGGITSGMIALYCAFIYLNLRMNREKILNPG